MWIKFGQEVKDYFETDAAFKLIQLSLSDDSKGKNSELSKEELNEITKYFFTMIEDEDGYCSYTSLRETILRMMPSGPIGIELLETYQVDRADLNSDDDGDLLALAEEEAEEELLEQDEQTPLEPKYTDIRKLMAK